MHVPKTERPMFLSSDNENRAVTHRDKANFNSSIPLNYCWVEAATADTWPSNNGLITATLELAYWSINWLLQELRLVLVSKEIR